MMLAAVGMSLVTMVGPQTGMGIQGQPAPTVVRISKPGSAPIIIHQTRDGDRVNGAIVVPVDSRSGGSGGGGTVTVVGSSESDGYVVETYQPRLIYTEQLLRAFDHSSFGYTVIHYPRTGWHGGGGRFHYRARPEPMVDPRVTATLRDAAPIESRFPAVPGR